MMTSHLAMHFISYCLVEWENETQGWCLSCCDPPYRVVEIAGLLIVLHIDEGYLVIFTLPKSVTIYVGHSAAKAEMDFFDRKD